MDKRKVESLYKEHYQRMHRLAMSLLVDDAESQDTVSEIFTRLLAADMSIGEGDEARYLARCVRNECLNKLRNKGVRERFATLYSEEHEESYADSDWEDKAQRLNEFMAENFSERMIQVYTLRFAEGKKMNEIAAELGISRIAVYKHIVHCINMVKQNFKFD